MAWRNIVDSIFDASLELINECVESRDAEACAGNLLAAADAAYTPLKPVDAGLGEARRIASLIAGIIANSFILLARERLGEEADSFIKAVSERLKELQEQYAAESLAGRVLEKAAVTGFEPAVSREARESLVNDIVEYVEPPRQAIPRRRRQPRRPEPRQRLRRLLRELGRRDPVTAKSLSLKLRRLGIPV